MRKPLTDAVMLKAAQRRLAEHLDTRPATQAEAHAIRDAHMETADALLSRADEHYAARYESVTGDSAPYGWYTAHVAAGMQCKSQAGWHVLQAAAWECPGEDMRDVWEATRKELADRVDYYACLCRREAVIV